MSRVVLLLAAVTLAGLAAPASATAPSGLYGTVRKGPISPVCRVGVPCDAPATNTTFLLTRDGAKTRVRTDSTGHYRVRLRPGRYAVSRTYRGPGSIRPASVRVPVGRFARANLFIDTGIR